MRWSAQILIFCLNKINDGIEEGKYCGDGGDLPGRVITLQGPVELEFRSDTSANEAGFVLNYNILPLDKDSKYFFTVQYYKKT